MNAMTDKINAAVLNRFRTLGLVPLGNMEGWHGVWVHGGPGEGGMSLVAVMRMPGQARAFARKHWGASKNWTVTRLHAEDVFPGLVGKPGTVVAPTTRNARQPHRYCHWCCEQGDHSGCDECARLDRIDAAVAKGA